jgi:hypothetical protein
MYSPVCIDHKELLVAIPNLSFTVMATYFGHRLYKIKDQKI